MIICKYIALTLVIGFLILAKENGQFIGTAHGNILYSENLY